MTDLTPRDIAQLDQAAVDALSDVDALAADPETTRRLADKGEAVYGCELTRDLQANLASAQRARQTVTMAVRAARVRRSSAIRRPPARVGPPRRP